VPVWWEPQSRTVLTVENQGEKEGRVLLDQRGFPLSWRVYGLELTDEGWALERRWGRLLVVVAVTLSILPDAFFEIRDDRLLKDDVDGSILLDPGSLYSRGIVELRGIQSLTSLLAKQRVRRTACVSVELSLCALPIEVALLTMMLFAVSTVNKKHLWETPLAKISVGPRGPTDPSCLSTPTRQQPTRSPILAPHRLSH